MFDIAPLSKLRNKWVAAVAVALAAGFGIGFIVAVGSAAVSGVSAAPASASTCEPIYGPGNDMPGSTPTPCPR